MVAEAIGPSPSDTEGAAEGFFLAEAGWRVTADSMDLSVLECPEPARRSPSGRIEKLLNLGSVRAGGFNVLELEHLHIHVAGTPGKDTFDLHLMARMRFRITEA